MTTLASFATDAQNFIYNELSPLMSIFIIVARFVGIMMIAIGLGRLHRHGHHHMMHRISPVSTIFYFVSGATLVSFMPELTAFSSGLADSVSASHLLTACEGTGHGLPGQTFCPLIAYANNIDPTTSTDTYVVKELAFAVLTLAGVYSFIKGFALLVKVGDGHSQQGGVGKAFTHIIAGVVGVNAEFFYNVFQNILSGFGAA